MKKVLCMILALALLVSLCACGTTNEIKVETVQAEPDVTVRVMALNGPTGFGMAGLMHNSANGSAKQTYDFSVETDASNITAALISGSVDIAALPTNAAAVVYNKTGGAVQALALNTRGVLHLVCLLKKTDKSRRNMENRKDCFAAHFHRFNKVHILLA